MFGKLLGGERRVGFCNTRPMVKKIGTGGVYGMRMVFRKLEFSHGSGRFKLHDFIWKL